MSEIDLVTALRQRIETEDELLNTRTTIFLATNGLWAASVGVSTAQTLQVGIALLGIAVTVLWMISSWQSYCVVRALTIRYLKELDAAPHTRKVIEDVVQGELRKWGHWRPSDIMAKWLPRSFLAIWLALLVALMAGAL